MILLHPHQYVYFNRVFGGGLKNASKDFETDYWGNSFKEGVDWLQENYRPATTVEKIKVGSCLHSASTAYYLKKDRFKYVGSIHDGKGISETPDIFLAVTRWNCDQAYQGEIIHTVRRMGAPLLFVIRVTDSGSG